MNDPADGVVERLRLGEGLVTAFVAALEVSPLPFMRKEERTYAMTQRPVPGKPAANA